MTERAISPLAERVLERMSALGLRQSALAERAGVHRGFISDLIRGRKALVRAEALARIAEALGTTAAYLEWDTHDPHPPPRPRPGWRPRVPALPLGFVAVPHPPEVHVTAEDAEEARAEAAYLASLEGWDPEDDVDDERRPMTPIEVHALTKPHVAAGPSRSVRGRLRYTGPIPIYEAERGRPLRVAEGPPARLATRPWVLWHSPGAYGVVWPDESGAPRVRQGETLLCAPRMPVREGDDVVALVKVDDDERSDVVLGRLGSARRDHIVVYGLGAGSETILERRSVWRLHRIAAIVTIPV